MAEAKPSSISRRRALESALEIIDNEGIEALSIRRLGEHMHIHGTSLYHHFGNKGEIVAGAARLALEEVGVQQGSGEPWRAWILRSAHQVRQAIRDHPELVPAMLSEDSLAVGAEEADATVVLLESGSVPTSAIVPMLEALELYAIGSALHETWGASATIDPDGLTDAPNLARALRHRALSAEDIFDTVCEKIIDAVMVKAIDSGPAVGRQAAEPA